MSQPDGSSVTRYVAGFYFNGVERDRVLLIEKQRPKWQKGRLNGVGGHIEPDELPRDAMVREFREETGVEVSADRWENFAKIQGPGFAVYFFTATWMEGDAADRQMTDEKLLWFDLIDMDNKVLIPPLISNLNWLIPMSAPTSKHDWPYLVEERHKDG